MYNLGASRQVEVWAAEAPVQKIQHEFNQKHLDVPVMVHVHSAGEFIVSAGEAAHERNSLQQSRRAIKHGVLKQFKKNTNQRIVTWKKEEDGLIDNHIVRQSRVGKPLAPQYISKDTFLVPLNDADDADTDSGETASSLNRFDRRFGSQSSMNKDFESTTGSIDLDKSFATIHSESSRARENLLRFTKGRRSFRVVSIGKSPTSKRRNKSVTASSLWTSVIGNEEAESPPSRNLSHSSVRFEGIDFRQPPVQIENSPEADVEGRAGPSVPYLHPPVPDQVLSSNNVTSRKARQDLFQPTTHATFVGREAFKTKEMQANFQAQVRKKEAAFARLLVRRKKALAEHQKLLQMQKPQQQTETKSLESEHHGLKSDSSSNIESSECITSAALSHEDLLQISSSTVQSVQSNQNSESKLAKSKCSMSKSALDGRIENEGKVQNQQKRREREESVRYIAALQQRLEEVCETKTGVKLPALCNCGSSNYRFRGENAVFHFEPFSGHGQTIGPHIRSGLVGWTPWEHCANNCRFYKNPQAYARELADVFRSLEM